VSLTLIIDDGRVQRELALGGTTVVGRDPECHISHADPRLSRRHAEFRVTPDGVTLRDLGSRNGTHVNGEAVAETVLRPGDVVQIAHLTIRFNDAAATQTVLMSRPAFRTNAAGVDATAPIDDRTRVLSPQAVASGRAETAAVPAARGRFHARPADRAVGSGSSSPGSNRPPNVASKAVNDVGDVVIRDESKPSWATSSHDLSVIGLAGTAWGRHVLVQGFVLALLLVMLTALPMLSWEVRLYGSSSLSSWAVLLPVVLAAACAGIVVASLIARTTARGLSSSGG